MKHTYIVSTLTMLLLCSGLSARQLDYRTFIRLVSDSNAALIAERYNITDADAAVLAARATYDPDVSFTYSNNQDWNLLMGQTYEVGLEYTVPLAPVRGRRVSAARAERLMAIALVQDYLRTLLSDAASAYADAWLAGRVEALSRERSTAMAVIARNDSLRLCRGETGAMAARQSALQATQALNDYQIARAAARSALARLSAFIGGRAVTSLPEELPRADVDFAAGLSELSLDSLTARALAARPDMQAARLATELSTRQLALVRAQRAPEVTLSAGYVHANQVLNVDAPAPAYDGFSVGVALPLKFSGANRGETVRAKTAVLKSQSQTDAAQQQIRAEVAEALNLYLASGSVLRSFDSSILASARSLVESSRLAYVSGDVSVFEMLAAEQTYNDLVGSYHQALADRFRAEAGLRAAIGL